MGLFFVLLLSAVAFPTALRGDDGCRGWTPSARDLAAVEHDYSIALEQIKQMLAKYRPDVTHLQGNAVLSPRILMLLIERSESQIPTGIFARLRPLAEAVLNRSELSIADTAGAPVSDDLRCKIRTEAQSAYGSLAKLHADVMGRP
jgi:hypothetical protein